MSHIKDQLAPIHATILQAMEAIKADSSTDPAVTAVVHEFHRVSHKAIETASGSDEHAALHAVLELEQAGDSAKVAVAADTHSSSAAKEAVVAAHDAVANLK